MIGNPDFPREQQYTFHTCGSCCAYMIASHFGADVTYSQVKAEVETDRHGTNEAPIVRFLRSCGLRVAWPPRMSWKQLVQAIEGGCVVLAFLDGNKHHYAVVHALDGDDVYLSDPMKIAQWGRTTSIDRFKARWNNGGFAIRPRSPMRRRAKKKRAVKKKRIS